MVNLNKIVATSEQLRPQWTAIYLKSLNSVGARIPLQMPANFASTLKKQFAIFTGIYKRDLLLITRWNSGLIRARSY